MNDLQGMRVVITGAGSGIGRATAELLAARGACLVLSDVKEQAVSELAAELARGQSKAVIPQGCNVRDAADCQHLIDAAVRQLGGLDALVHCAGILRPAGSRPRPLWELDDAEYNAVVGTNLQGTFFMNRAALRILTAQRTGQIINISSTSGQKGRPLDSLYSASKAGVIGLSESIAEEARPFGVRVQVLLPDAVATPLWEQNGPLVPPPPGSLPAGRIAEIIAMCLSLPYDTFLDKLVIAPFRLRKGRGRTSPESSP